MSIVDQRRRNLIIELLSHHLSEAEFYNQFPMLPGTGGTAGLEILQAGLAARDPIAVEFGLYLGHRFGLTRAYVNTLSALAVADWHERHEDVVDALKKLEAPESVEALYAAAQAKYAYRDYDEAESLGVKSLYALGAIRNEAAVRRIGDLLSSRNDILSAEAKKRLERIAASDAPDAVRRLASSLLSGSNRTDRDP